MSDFATEIDQSGAVEIVRLRAPGDTSAEVVPTWGGSCIAFRAAGHSVLEAVSLDEIAKKPTSYGIPILFPFPNRIRDGRFSWEGKDYQLPGTDHIQHQPVGPIKHEVAHFHRTAHVDDDVSASGRWLDADARDLAARGTFGASRGGHSEDREGGEH